MSKKRADATAWDSTSDFLAVLQAVKPVGTKRRYRLFMCGCCRTLLWDQITDERTQNAIVVAEAYADNQVERGEVDRSKRAAVNKTEIDVRLEAVARSVLHGLPDREAREMPYFCLRPWRTRNYNKPTRQQQAMLCHLVRDIFGNPFRPVAFLPEWRTSTAVALAGSMYASRDFGPMPVLADALEEAGCDNADVLSHCRGDGPHVRGCWVVDLVLGKS